MIKKANLLEFGQALQCAKILLLLLRSTLRTILQKKNNPGKACDKSASSEKAQCLAQVSYEESNHKFRVLDIQGTGHKLNDSIMASFEFHQFKTSQPQFVLLTMLFSCINPLMAQLQQTYSNRLSRNLTFVSPTEVITDY